MAWQLRALAVPADGSGAAPNTHTRQLTTISNSNVRGSNALFWPRRELHGNSRQTQAGTYTHINKEEKKNHQNFLKRD